MNALNNRWLCNQTDNYRSTSHHFQQSTNISLIIMTIEVHPNKNIYTHPYIAIFSETSPCQSSLLHLVSIWWHFDYNISIEYLYISEIYSKCKQWKSSHVQSADLTLHHNQKSLHNDYRFVTNALSGRTVIGSTRICYV